MRSALGILVGSALAVVTTFCLVPTSEHSGVHRNRLALSLKGGALIPMPAHRLVGGDDSVWINQGIQNALAQGLTSYQVPAGTYTLQNPIIVPPATINFSLQGAGSALTILTSPSAKMTHMIRVGSLYNHYRNNGSTRLLATVKQGDTSVILPMNFNLPLNKYYTLQDDYLVYNASDPARINNHFELVKFTSYSPTTGRATLDKPAAREYNLNPAIFSADAETSQNVSVSGFGMDGTIIGTTIDASDRLVYAVLVDGLNLTDLRVQTFQSAGLEVDECRNVQITNSSVNGAVDKGAGQGYGFILRHSRFVNVSNSSADGCRHGFILHSGTTDTTLDTCASTGPYSNIDLHGFDERRVVIKNCSCGTTINIGNDKWLAGAKSVTIQNCTMGGALILCPNASGITVTNSSLGGVKTTSSNEPLSSPTGGYPDLVKFDTCSFTTGNSVFTNQISAIGTISFNLCTFESTRTDWGSLFSISQFDQGTLNFTTCKFTVDSLRPADVPFQIYAGGVNAKVVIRGSQFISNGGSLCAVLITAPFAGHVSLTTNTFTSLNPLAKVSFFINTSTIAPSFYGNVIK